jgi:hypothetical protein
MMGPSVFKRSFLILPVIFLVLSLILIFSQGCRQIGANISGKISDKAAQDADQETGSQAVPGFPEGFPSEVPIYPGAGVVEASKNKADNKTTFQVRMQGGGDIGKLSDWYKQKLEKDWEMGTVSEGDMGDWSEFYTEAQNKDYFLTVYLYQDEGSDIVSIDLNVNSLTEGEAVAENNKQGGKEDSETESAETTSGQSEQSQPAQSGSGDLESTKIAFVCASVGAAWNVGQHFPQLDISVYDEYQFDKGYRIQEILESEKPDIMIIKECAAYFPPDLQGSSMSAYQDLIRDWINLCRGQGVIPVLTTVVPINPDNPSNAGQPHLDSILEFNDWIKQYCSDEEISVLDLEKALRISDSDRALNPGYDSGDGLHPNELAYTEKLDNILIPALERALDIGH